MTAELLARPALPPMQGHVADYGYDGRYVLFTRAHVEYGTWPAYWQGGPAKCTVNGWSVSYGTGGLAPGAELSMTNQTTGERIRERFADDEACQRRAFQLGALAYMIYVKDFAAYGITP